MKQPSTYLCPIVLAGFLSLLPTAVFAHPGHGLHEGGLTHWLTSPDHLAVLALAGLAAWCGGMLVKDARYRKVLRYAGSAAVVSAALLWSFSA